VSCPQALAEMPQKLTQFDADWLESRSSSWALKPLSKMRSGGSQTWGDTADPQFDLRRLEAGRS
jgi:hypothetical protein